MITASTAGRPGGPPPYPTTAFRPHSTFDNGEGHPPGYLTRRDWLGLDPCAGCMPGRVHLSPANARAARRIMARQSRQRLIDSDAAERSRYLGLAPGAIPAQEVVNRVCRAVSL